MLSCELRTCRYNKDGICSNQDKHQECVDIAKKVLCNYIDKTNSLRLRCHDKARDYFDKGNYGALHIVTADELK